MVEYTYTALLIVQALHLLHHRLVRRQISYVEGVTGLLLCVNPAWMPWSEALAVAHITAISVQIIGSLFIYRLSPSG